jgi:hypothetical protein
MRRESVAAILLVVVCVCVVGAAVVWSDDRPAQSTWVWRVGLSVAAIAAIAALIRLQFSIQSDLVPDFLSANRKTFFEQNGLCFSIYATSEDGVFCANAMYQNRYDQSCRARIVLRPVAGVFRPAVGPFRSDFPTIVFDISCGPAGFGIASVPLPVSSRHQGKNLTLQIGASVDYPAGKGKKLRFRDGSLLRYDAEFRNSYMRILQVLYLFCGGLLFSFPASVTFCLPDGVAESLPAGQGQRTRTLWTLGDEVIGIPPKAEPHAMPT